MNRLNSIRFFAEMGDDKEEWLEENQVEAEMDMADAGVDIEVLDVGESGFVDLEEEVLTNVLARGVQPAMEVRRAFPLKTGSGGLKGRATLALLVKFWTITVDFEKMSGSETITFLLNGEAVPKFDGEVFVFNRVDNDPICIESTVEKGVDPIGILKSLYTEKKVQEVEMLFHHFTPAAHKSLIQKIIRFRPNTVQGFTSTLVAHVSFATLANMSGSFVPDIKRFVTGLESALKRLAVCILEDSFTERTQDMLSIMVMAFLAQRTKSFSPSFDQWNMCFSMIGEAIEESRYFVYDIPAGMKADTCKIGLEMWSNISALMDELRSFQSDLGMIRSITHNEGVGTRTFRDRPETMPVCHCVDFHWAPEIIYYFDPVIIDVEEGSKPFRGFYRRIFREVTGFNPRKSGSFSESEPFVKKVRSAQKLVLRARQKKKKERTKTGEIFVIDCSLDDAWLAGMVGTQEIPGRPPMLVTLNPYDYDVKTALRKPSRDMKQSELTAEQEEKALERMDERLESGILLKHPPLSHLEGAKWNGKEVILKRGKRVSWNTARTTELEIPLLEPIADNLKTAIKYGDYGYVDAGVSSLIAKFPMRIVRRALGYMSGSPRSIEMPRISRDGGGSHQSVIVDDVATFQFLLRLSAAVPAMIRLAPHSSIRFDVPSPPTMWFFRDILLRKIASFDTNCIAEGDWSKLGDTMGRTMWAHQREGVDEMLERKSKGYKGNFLWYNVGMGKTLLVLEYLRRVPSLPPHIVYTLPSEAIKSVAQEIEAYGFRVQLWVPLKGKARSYPVANVVNKATDLEPFVVTLIEHDHLRRAEEDLKRLVQRSIFIVDEVHKTFNDSKRTSMAKDLSKLSIDFIVLTGTPIIDNKMYKLIWWLQQIMPFNVTEKNFWVAISGMVSRKVNTGVIPLREEVEAKMDAKVAKRYQELVPPHLGGSNTHASFEAIHKATQLCYRITSNAIVDETVKEVEDGKGVMVVAKSAAHQEELRAALVARGVSNIYVLEKNKSIHLVDESKEDYDVVIVPLNKSTGYSLTKLKVMITGVYPSNHATRDQLEGRIIRIGQKEKFIRFKTVHCGILTYIMENHKDARNLMSIMQTLVKES